MTVRLLASSLLLATVAFTLPATAAAQDSAPPSNNSQPAPAGHAAPLFDSNADIGRMQSSAFNTPEADGRPGEYFFFLGAQATKHKDYVHALAMYKVASSWAYKPAEYNLAVMYLNGQGTPIDLARALAWMALAAERNDPRYVKARDLINSHLTDAQFKEANLIMAQLLPTYGDKVALARASARWREVRAAATGSRVGSAAGALQVGAVDGDANHMQSPNYDVHDGGHVGSSAAEVAGVHQTDGSIAYQQLRASNNPYDPKFEWQPGSTGVVTIEPLLPVKESAVKKKKAASSSMPAADNSNH